jgi:hypothetical protein
MPPALLLGTEERRRLHRLLLLDLLLVPHVHSLEVAQRHVVAGHELSVR